VAFRFGHSMLNNNVARDNNDGSAIGTSTLQLAQDFFDPNLINPSGVTDPLTGLVSTDIGALLKGDADNSAQAVDVMAVSDIRNLLFDNGPPGSPVGDDLIARDIWRADDHGIGTYNMLRQAFGLAPITDTGESAPGILPGDPGFRFHGFEQISSDPAVVQKLITAFTGPSRNTPPDFLSTGHSAGDINPFIAGLAEDHVGGSDMGPLFTNILVDQFSRLRDGDQYFYLNESFTPAESVILNSGDTLGQLIRNNTTITNLQPDVFRVLSTESAASSAFYTSKDGKTALTGSSNGNQLTSSIYNGILAALANPSMPGYLVLVNASGNYMPASYFQNYGNLKDYLRNVNTNNMSYALSAQLLVTELNILTNRVDPTTSIFVPAVTIPGTTTTLSQTLQDSLFNNGVTNSSGIVNIQDLMNATITELLAVSNTKKAGDHRTFQEALTDCFAGINANEAIFIL
jgi:hypothetical protein